MVRLNIILGGLKKKFCIKKNIVKFLKLLMALDDTSLTSRFLVINIVITIGSIIGDSNSFIAKSFYPFFEIILLFYEREWTQILVSKDVVEFPEYFRGNLLTSLSHWDSSESLL